MRGPARPELGPDPERCPGERRHGAGRLGPPGHRGPGERREPQAARDTGDAGPGPVLTGRRGRAVRPLRPSPAARMLGACPTPVPIVSSLEAASGRQRMDDHAQEDPPLEWLITGQEGDPAEGQPGGAFPATATRGRGRPGPGAARRRHDRAARCRGSGRGALGTGRPRVARPRDPIRAPPVRRDRAPERPRGTGDEAAGVIRRLGPGTPARDSWRSAPRRYFGGRMIAASQVIAGVTRGVAPRSSVRS